MKFLFKQSALLGKRGLAATVGEGGKKIVPPHGGHGKIYAVGVHEVSEEHQQDATFKHFAKHGLIVPYKPKEQGKLKAAESDIAKVSMDAAKSQLEPDAEIGGDDDEADDNSKGHRKVRRK